MQAWLLFFASAAVIFYAGRKLCILGDVIGDKLGIGQVWIGAFLLAMVTSLPEVSASVSAVVYAHAPDLALGNIFGSIAFNLLLVAVIDFFMGRKLLFRVLDGKLDMPFAAMLLMMSLAFLASVVHVGPRIGPLGWSSWLIITGYLMSVQLMFAHDRQFVIQEARVMSAKNKTKSLNGAVFLFILFSAILVVATTRLTASAHVIARVTGLGETFVGSLLLAMVTSLPEFTVSYQAVREGLYGMSVGNLFGSNTFNVFIMPVADFFMPGGSVVAMSEPTHLCTLAIAFLMSALIFIGMIRKPKKQIGYFSVDSILIAAVYGLGMFALYQLRVVS